MSEKILKIEESYFKYEETYSMEGFKVTTDKQEILVGISSYQSCCENFGYFMTNDNIDDFVGASLNSVHITDDLLKVEDFDKKYSGQVMFVNFETSKGTLQFVAYNDHNGYYGHQGVIISEQLSHNEIL